ncbi:MAG: 2-C-methyl-D-erythritol 2,4-cyclodiphosphate synthase [Bacteroidetes bacterium]|nr:2-C-methyl-D-erythritol 2,4-cyclodiphosphate synthase [Bacteroidota bacterium]
MRVGIGYDIHRLVKERALILGGIKLPFHLGLLGHSDADVLVHAIMDAMLGAAGLQDIGYYFSDNDPQFKNADSLNLLKKVANLIKEKNYKIINIDSIIIAERPKIAPNIPAMKKKLANILNITTDLIGIKATTNEGLGEIGTGAAIAAKAVVLLE